MKPETYIRKHDTCALARRFIRGFKTMAQAWNACKNLEWLLLANHRATSKGCPWDLSADAEDRLRTVALQLALSVAHHWNAPDIVLKYLFTGNPGLRLRARALVRQELQTITCREWQAARAAEDATSERAYWAIRGVAHKQILRRKDVIAVFKACVPNPFKQPKKPKRQ